MFHPPKRRSCLAGFVLAVLAAACAPGLRANAPAQHASQVRHAQTGSAPERAGHDHEDDEFAVPEGLGAFIVALCEDVRGNVWVGTEGLGVWCYDPHEPKRAGRWTQFTRQSTSAPPEPNGAALSAGAGTDVGLGDDCADALACDKLGRIWVGHLNHGVSVYDGRPPHVDAKGQFPGWRNYDVPSGPLGERVFDIATCPTDGDVWIATNAGLTRYSLEKDVWTHVTPGIAGSAGLPSEDVQCLAFGTDGTLYVGMQCHGVAIGTRVEGKYKRWHHVAAPAGFGPDGQSPIPLAPYGTGLSTNLVNDVLVAKDGAVYAATTTGLAWSRDRGHTWYYLRGRDWKAKAEGLYRKPAQLPKIKTPPALLEEDYLNTLAEDGEARIWAGGWRRACVVLDPRRKRIAPPEAKCHFDFVTAMAPTNDGRMLIATYGDGLRRLGPKRPDGTREESPRPFTEPPPLPSPAASPWPEDLEAMADELQTAKTIAADRQPKVIKLDDDWRTQGDWLGRVGRYWACLSAICAPHDYVWGAGRNPVVYSTQMGPHRPRPDLMRYWVWQNYDTDRRVLELPHTYLHSRVLKELTTWDRNRRPAGWDDHGEAYPYTFEGPNMVFTLEIPKGQFVLSFYFVNYDGHQGHNRHRDYVLSIRPHPAEGSTTDIGDFDRRPELARCRVKDWYGGVYKRFYVRGPQRLCVKQDKNWSFNTMLMGIFLDSFEEEPDPYFLPTSASRRPGPGVGAGAARQAQTARCLREVWATLQRNPAVWAARRLEVSAAVWRNASGHARPGDLPVEPEEKARVVGTCCWLQHLYPQWEATQRERRLTTAREIEKTLFWDGVSRTMEGEAAELIREYHINRVGEVFKTLEKLRERDRKSAVTEPRNQQRRSP